MTMIVGKSRIKSLFLSALMLGCFLVPNGAAGSPLDPPQIVRPIPKCPVGLVCFTPEEIGEIEAKFIELEKELKVAQANAGRKLGGCVGVGGGARLLLDDDGLSMKPDAIGVFYVWGLRLK